MDYKKTYEALMSKCKNQNRKKGTGVYYEAHHVVPVCFGGKGDRRNTKHPNIVLLTAKEHYVAHLLLVAIYPVSPCMLKALWNMCQTGKVERYRPSARTFERIRSEYAEKTVGKNASFFGRRHTQESLIKIGTASKGRKANLGNKYSEETCKRLSEIAKQRKFSKETRKKISAAIGGGKHYKAIPIVCKKTGQIFGSGRELFEFINIPFSTIRRWLNGTTPPPKTFHYYRQNLAYDQ